MSVFKHPKSLFYQIDFRLNGHNIRGSSTKSKQEAESIERDWRAKAVTEADERKRTGSGQMTLSIPAGRYMTEVCRGRHPKPISIDPLNALSASLAAQH